MNDQQKPRPVFWPLVFIGAFVVGAMLWALWMTHVIRQTREIRDSSFFVPMNTNAPPRTPTNNPPTSPHSP